MLGKRISKSLEVALLGRIILFFNTKKPNLTHRVKLGFFSIKEFLQNKLT